MLNSHRTLLQLLASLPVQRCSSSPLKIAAHPWPGYELLFLAQREGPYT